MAKKNTGAVKFNKGLVKHNNKNVESLEQGLALLTKCHCFGADCCPIPHIKLEDATGAGNDYIWNNAGVLVIGTKDEMEAFAATL